MWGEQRCSLIPAVACGLHSGQRFVINDIDASSLEVAYGSIREFLRLTNHSSEVYAFREPAETLHYTLWREGLEMGLTVRGGVANAAVFSPPYCPLADSRERLRGFRGGLKAPTNGNYKAFIGQLVSSAYIMLRLYGRCVVVVKDAVASGLKKPVEDVVAEAMGFVGFRDVKVHRFLLEKPSAFAEYHRARGHRHEHLQHEYVIVGQKLPTKRVG
ncbi:MAG: hypothetical protein QXV62_00685 [Nitrososphaerota archaeon]